MSLVKIDWKPDAKKVRQFGALLVVFSLIVGAASRRAGLAAAGSILGLLTLLLPRNAGLWVYKAWMCVAFVVGTAVSNAVLVLIYYGILTPLALGMRLFGRDPLRLRPAPTDSCWVPVEIPKEKTYFERLY